MSALAIALTVALWWGSTGLIALLVRRGPRHFPALLAVASVVAVLGLAVLVVLRDATDAAGAFAAFCAALALWAWIEITFLTGAITGPVRALPPGMPRRGWRHALAAFTAILWHEHEKATEPGRKPDVKKPRGKRGKTST